MWPRAGFPANAPTSLTAPPLFPGPVAQPGWAAPWTVHVLGLALAASAALRLSAGWWRHLAADLRERKPHPGYSPLLTLAVFAAAFGLECAYYTVVPSFTELTDLWARSPLVLWALVLLRLAPYAAAAYLVPRLSGRSGAGGLVLDFRGLGWPEVRPAFRTIVPWAVVLLLVGYFPAVSQPGRLWTVLRLWLTTGGHLFLTSLLSLPFFLGVAGPTLGSALVRLFGLDAPDAAGRAREAPTPVPGGSGTSDDEAKRADPGGWTEAHVLHAVAGAAVVFLWLFLPRPGAAYGLVGTSGFVLYYGILYLAAAHIQGASRNVLWPVLGLTLAQVCLSMVPALLGLVFRW